MLRWRGGEVERWKRERRGGGIHLLHRVLLSCYGRPPVERRKVHPNTAIILSVRRAVITKLVNDSLSC